MDYPSQQPEEANAEIPQPPESGGYSEPRSRRPAGDTVIMYNADAFNAFAIRNIPLPEFKELTDLIARNFGININESKLTLVVGRIHPMMEKYGFNTHRECLDAIKNDASGALLSELANRISTNHTAFFREDAHFKALADTVLPELTRRKEPLFDHDLRIWCAACATGEEAYSILFTLLRFFNFDYHKWRAGVLATDISAAALATARRGVYNSQRLEPVPPESLNMYFERLDAENYMVRPELRKEVTFRRLNLMNATYPFRQPFDVIFCRNVMIYFNRGNRIRLLDRLRDWLVLGGFLFVGHSESIVGQHKGYEYFAPAVYRRSD